MKNILSARKIKKLLAFDLDVQVFEELESTNIYAKNAPRSVIFALRQTGGRGRLNKSFFSGEGGLYFSMCFTADGGAVSIGDNRVPTQPGRLTIAAGIAVCKTLCAYGYDARIKWVNDVFVDGKKVCGILAEGAKDRVVVGIGVNLNSDIPDELSVIATSLHYHGDFNEIAAKVVNEFAVQAVSPDMDYFCEKCLTLGKKVHTRLGDGVAVGVRHDGALLVEIDGEVKPIFYGEAIIIDK